ncbi:MAG: F0F1 ATP synthase subunit B [Ignavibacteria bacterium]|nr:F0F1 ATP synthase subunit B [Ignavibacteria bacterium]
MTLAYFYSAELYGLLMFFSPSGEKKDTLLSVEPGLLIWTVIIFLILLFILKKFAWGPLLKSLNDREQSIKDSVEKAEYLKQEAEKLLAEHRQMLSKADEEARRMLAEAKDMAEKHRNDMLAKTQDDAAKMIANAKAEIEREKVSAMNSLRDEIASLAVMAAGKIIEKNLDPSKQKDIIDSFINKMPQN